MTSTPDEEATSRVPTLPDTTGLLHQLKCGYLSTHGVPPACWHSQHAQSLCVLIHAVNPTLESAEVAGGDQSVPYTNDGMSYNGLPQSAG
ncbi:hypothetical protein P885DRAFT_77992 [Corynascus similis CBS 632.67]